METSCDEWRKIMQNGVGFQSISKIVKKYWWVIVALIIIGGAWGALTAKRNVSYEATARIYVDKADSAKKSDQIIVYNSDSDRFWQNIGSLGKTDRFNRKMSTEFSDFKSNALSIDNTNGSNIFSFKYADSTAKKSAKVANYAVKQVSKELEYYSDEPLTIKVIDRATTKEASQIVLSNKKSHTLMGVIYGFIIGFIVSAIHFLIFNKKK